jgi:hypothetical protein
MISIRWMPSAYDELAAIWMSASSERRRKITDQVDLLEHRLQEDAKLVGEGREPPSRIVVMRDLIVDFDVHDDDHLVIVTSIRSNRYGQGG